MADRDPSAALKSLCKLGRRDRERISAAIGQLPAGDVKASAARSASGDFASASGASSLTADQARR
jgi:hypothetical protein